MSLIDEAYNSEIEETSAPDMGASDYQEEPTAGGDRFAMPDLSFLAARTGEGSVDEYINHPLNFDNRASTARILRGCTGLCGQLDYALIDIALGVIEKIKEKGEKNKPREWSNINAN